MQHVLSTRSIANHRLNTVWLNRIWEAGIPLIELFCARQHLDYRDKAQITELGHWFRDARLKVHSAHSPIHDDLYSGRSGPSSHLSIVETTKAKRIQIVDEIKRAIEMAETIPFTYLVQHLGSEYEEFDERKLDAAFTSLEELNIFARPRGVHILLENMNSGLASAEKLVHFNRITHLNLNYCFDLGHAYLFDGGIEAEIEPLQPNIKLVHVHDNNGKEDSHLLPGSVSLGIDWRKTMHLLRGRTPEAALVLETSERAESANPLDDARRAFEYLENQKPLHDPEEER